MARRTTKTVETNTNTEATEASAPEENIVSDVTEATVETVATETTEPVEATAAEAVEAPVEAAPAEAKPAEVEVDLTAFIAAVDAAVTSEDRDEVTGTLSDALIESVNVEYRKLDGVKAKNRARAYVETTMKALMVESKFEEAVSYMSISDNLSAAGSGSGSTSTPRKPVDPTEAHVELVAGLNLAYSLAVSHVPDGVDASWQSKVDEKVSGGVEFAETFRTWLLSDAEDKGDEPEGDAFVKAAVKLALGKSAKVGGKARATSSTPFNGTRRDVAKHIQAAFADKASGEFLSIADIRKARSEEYGDDAPSQGAISARLFPKDNKPCTVEGVIPATDDKSTRGARKA